MEHSLSDKKEKFDRATEYFFARKNGTTSLLSTKGWQNMKRAAVYDRWLYTLGGGEQVAFNFAMMLRDLGYKTEILTHKEIDKKKAEEKLFVDLKNITIVYLPLTESSELSQYTEGYDVFINTSYLDYFPNRAKFGILSIFFPSKISLNPFEYMKRALILPSGRRFFIYPIQYEGFSHDQYINGRIYKWLGKNSSILMNKRVDAMHLQLFFDTVEFSQVDSIQFYVDGKKVSPQHRHLVHTKNAVEYHFDFAGESVSKFTITLPPASAHNKIALVQLTIPGVRFFVYNLFKKYFPRWEMRLHGGPGVTRRSDILSYDKIVTISEFSKKWIRRYWGLSSDVLYPSTETGRFITTAKKKNRILHVGRFFVTGHSKKQLELVKTFIKLVQEKKCNDWELHFVGSVHEGEKHQQYFEQVRHLAAGYNVFFHTDVKFSKLQELLSTAKIYWHATGMDENEEINPILFEHFGITTVEAMASGCVPVVINAGGQKEIVTEGSGYLWKNRQELMEFTYRLMSDEALWKEKSKGAIARAAFFDRKKLLQRFRTLLQVA